MMGFYNIKKANKRLYAILFLVFFLVTICKSQSKQISIYFPFAESEISLEQKTKLLYFLSDSIQDKFGYTIQIKGYCDFIDDDTLNNTLSQKRADFIRNMMMQNGFDSSLIILCKGYGEKNANQKNDSDEERSLSRRVDIFFNQKNEKNQVQNSIIEIEKKGTAINLETISISDLEVNETIILENLNFQPGRHKLVQSSVPTLKKLFKVMHENPTLEIKIVGHICCEPNTALDGMDLDTKKVELSVNRAKEIYTYLVNNGIDASRMQYEGRGAKEKLIYPETSIDDENSNRRVEIEIIKL